ncbi:MAG TPA: NifB/NifX family molybdenum-iron cluster-binding protein [Mariprofundaceae bacterium]|nr:NifB/NifX family molybdenum-iron cluster-binding protein [Mariprofundaceae bacterium]
MLRIAVASRDGIRVAGHIGKCADWIVFEVQDNNAADAPHIFEAERVSLAKAFVFHHYKDDAPHPLQACSVVIGASAGDSFVEKMQRRGIEVVLTAESDPVTAVADYVCHTLTPAKPRPIGGLICKIHDALSSG